MPAGALSASKVVPSSGGQTKQAATGNLFVKGRKEMLSVAGH